MNNVSVRHLTKKYKDFTLEDVSFDVPAGCVVGFIGENGAGKSTTIKSILGLVNPDGGEIQVFGKDAAALSKKEKNAIGAVLGENCLPENLTLRDVSAVMRLIFAGWNEQSFFAYAEKFALPEDKKIRNFSRGMQQKAALAVALSHGAELLVLDEPTSGLDPVARDEILGFLYDFMQEERRSVLISSHIVSLYPRRKDRICGRERRAPRAVRHFPRVGRTSRRARERCGGGVYTGRLRDERAR